MKEKKAFPARKNPPRESMSVRVAPRLKQLLNDSAAVHRLTPARWIERVLWASKEVQEALLHSASPSNLPEPAPVDLYTLDEITLAHLTLLARATHHLEQIARVVDHCRRERQVVDEMRLAETLHSVKDQLDRLRPLHLAQPASATIRKAVAESTP